jgi:hypothetical protein
MAVLSAPSESSTATPESRCHATGEIAQVSCRRNRRLTWTAARPYGPVIWLPDPTAGDPGYDPFSYRLHENPYPTYAWMYAAPRPRR